MTAIREKRRREILAAALEIFSRDGYHKGTVEDIARLAGIGKATVYEYFSSKQEIFQEMLVHFLRNYEDLAREKTASQASVRQKLLVLFDFNMEFLDRNAEVIERVFLGLEEGSRDLRPTIMAFHKRLYHFFLDLVELGLESGEIGPGKNPHIVSLLLINMVYGLANSGRAFGVQEEIKGQDVMDLVFGGLA